MINVMFDCRVAEEPRLIADFGLEKILCVRVGINRISGVIDYIDLNYSNSTGLELTTDMFLHIKGDLRSVLGEDGLLNYVYSDDIVVLDNEPTEYQNSVHGKCILKRPPVYREKMNDSSVHITELDVKSARAYKRVSHARCTAWKRLARLTKDLEPGLTLEIEGRLQSHTNRRGKLSVEISLYSIKVVDLK